jgi:hypothetical protein
MAHIIELIKADRKQQHKTYADFMNEITSSEIYEGLLAYGLFAEQLPPIFTGKQFFDYCQNNNPSFPKDATGYVYYENMRNVNVPRSLGIPNPASYQRLCKSIENCWTNLQCHFQNITSGNPYKISRIHLRKLKDKQQLFEMNYNNWRIDGTPEPDLLIGSKYLVKADISNCFPSIYSHALSWALVGKAVAKQNQGDHSQWYNLLDFYTRNIHNGETHGLIIGPHVSNLLSEIILTKIDQKLFGDGWHYIRNIDDYSCYVKTHEEGQSFLVSLNEQLRYYGLSLNHKKTLIAELPAAAVEQWVRRINAFTAFDVRASMNYKEVQAYFDLAVELMQENSENSAVLKYAIKVLSKKQLSMNAKEYCVKTILHLALIYPYLITQLGKYVFDAFSVNASVIADFSQKLIDTGKQTLNHEEMCFAIYFAIKYNFALNGVTFDDIKDSNHCILLLLGFLYQKKQRNRIEIRLFKDFAESLIEMDMNTYWLFIYETLPQSKLKDYWADMKKKKVSFIEIKEV